MEQSMEKYQGEDATDSYSLAWNAAQAYLRCCGINNYTDWGSSLWYDNQQPQQIGGLSITLDYPATCCYIEDPSAIIGGEIPEPANITACIGYGVDVPNQYMYDEGCYSSLKNYLIDNILYIGAVGLGIAFIEIMGMVFACCVYRGVKKNEEIV